MNAIEGHTPLPWGIEWTEREIWVGPLRSNGKVAEIVFSFDLDELKEEAVVKCEANAALIVRAVNSHAEMVAALELAVATTESQLAGAIVCGCELCEPTERAFNQIKAALAKAKGEQ